MHEKTEDKFKRRAFLIEDNLRMQKALEEVRIAEAAEKPKISTLDIEIETHTVQLRQLENEFKRLIEGDNILKTNYNHLNEKIVSRKIEIKNQHHLIQDLKDQIVTRPLNLKQRLRNLEIKIKSENVSNESQNQHNKTLIF